MNNQCSECEIRKMCYLEEPKEDWTCDHYISYDYVLEDVGDNMSGNQCELNDRLEELCLYMYDDNKKKMLLDLLVVIGYWSEFELREE